MPSFRGARQVRHSAADMFDLVADFERYPQFVPLCLSARIRRRSVDPAGMETLIALMQVGVGPLRERFATRDVLDREGMNIRIFNLDGPFTRFESAWAFRDDVDRGGAQVEFSTDYEFRNPGLDALLGPMFDFVFRRLAQAFEDRANSIYRFTR